MNIYQKLIEVRKSCEYLKKDNSGPQFKFVSSSQTLGTLREAMDKHQLLLVPEVTTHETRDHTTKNGNHEYFTICTMAFTWINAENPEEKIVCPWLGQGLDSGEKGVGKAMTYAEKYFLLKFFNIATDKDDPDSFQKKYDDSPATPQGKIKKDLANDAASDALTRIQAKLETFTTIEAVDAWEKIARPTIDTLPHTQKAKADTAIRCHKDMIREIQAAEQAA